MNERRWPLAVHDERGRRHRGTVAWLDRMPAAPVAPRRPAEFLIVLLARPARTRSAPEATAICVPSHAIAVEPARAGSELVLDRDAMHAYARGRIIAPVAELITPADVFPARGERPRLDRLALTIVESVFAEAVAPYTALIRRELALRPGASPLAELARRLAARGLPARAPAMPRLRRAARQLADRSVPAQPLAEFAEDLRFLRLFDDEPMPPHALERLLADVREPAPARERGARVTPIDRRSRR
jgi:hypothetical protein